MPETSALPDTLWHYTDASGLWGMVSARQLRFGDARFLNDKTEKVYGERLLDVVFEEESSNGDAPEVVREIRNHMQMTGGPERLYVCSFSEMNDSIGQWQRYGRDGTGYCIGFDRARLDDLLDRDGVMREALIYNEDEQRKHIRSNIHRCVQYYLRSDSENKASPYDILTAGEVAFTAVRMKSPYFRDEREWRIIYYMDHFEADSDDCDETYAVAGSYIKPFVLLPRPRKRKVMSLLPITNVVCGPKLDRDIAVPTVERFKSARIQRHPRGYVCAG